MANTLKIVITASDKATATVRRVKDGIAQFTKPLRDVKNSVGSLGKELGVEKLTKGINKMAAGAVNLAKKTLGVVTALAAVAGVSTLAGLAALTREWTQMGMAILRASAILDIAPSKFQALTGAAEAFGLERESMTQGLKALGDTMEDALYGRNQGAMMMMNRLGISMHKTKNGSVDTARGLYDVADAIARVHNVQAQGVIARTFGVEQLLPFLQLGSKGIKQYEDAVRRSGAVMSGPALAASQAFGRQLIMLKLNLQGVGNSIISQLIPVLSPMIDSTTRWAQANRDVIGTRIKDFVVGLAQTISGLVTIINKVVESTIGWKGAGIALAAVLAGRLLLSIVGLVKPIVTVTAYIATLALSAIPGLLLQAGLLADALGLTGLSGVFVALGAAIEATPIGWILTALAALGFAGYELYKHWDQVKGWLSGVWSGITGLFTAGYKKIAAIAEATANLVRRMTGHKVPAPPSAGGPQGAPGQAGWAGRPTKAGAVNPTVAAQVMAFYQAHGWTKEQAAGLVGNLAGESALNPNAVGDNGNAYGLAQWHKDRADAFKRWSGGKPLVGSSLRDQLEFSQFELTQGGEQHAGNALRQAKTIGEAVAAAVAYERPADPAAAQAKRTELAKNFYGAGGNGPQVASNYFGAAGAGGPTVVGMPARDDKLTVTVHGLPKGSTVVADKSNVAAGKVADVRVNYSLPDLATL